MTLKLEGEERLAQFPDTVEPQLVAEKFFAIMERASMEQSGKFYHREGQELPW